MTKAQYARYEKRVAEFFEREKVTNLSPGRVTCSNCEAKLHQNGCCDETCPECGANVDCMNEGYFSHHSCECCGSNLGGNRYIASGYCPKPNGSISGEGGECFEFEICEDCLYYTTYGRLDDTTMLEMEGS
jgi:hypothetical protein